MCVNFLPVSRPQVTDLFLARFPGEEEYKSEVWKDYLAPIIRLGQDGKREASLANFAFRPKRHMPQNSKAWDTMNARSESIGSKPEFARYWRASQHCLVPMYGFFEPNWESGTAERWLIGMADCQPFAVAGLWRAWEEQDGNQTLAFTEITINADDHPLMRRFHRPPAPGEPPDKRSLVIIQPEEYDAWLNCRNPELARTFLKLYPAERMQAWHCPKPSRL